MAVGHLPGLPEAQSECRPFSGEHQKASVALDVAKPFDHLFAHDRRVLDRLIRGAHTREIDVHADFPSSTSLTVRNLGRSSNARRPKPGSCPKGQHVSLWARTCRGRAVTTAAGAAAGRETC